MAIAAPIAGARILVSDLSAFYNLLKGVSGSGETVTLIYNATGALIFQPSSDPASSTQLVQIKKNDGTVRFALTAGGQVLNAKSADIASATTTDLSTATGNYAVITGTTTITGLGTVQAGTVMVLEFSGILTLTHNATSLILRAGASATTAAGDVYTFVSEGSGNWREIGHLVAASAASGMTQISKQTLGSASATITFSSIPGTYTNLMLVLQGRGDTAATSVIVGMQFNADTGANYDDVRPAASNTAWAFGEDVAATSINIMNMAAASSAANVADQTRIDIVNYAGTTFQKSCTAQSSLKLAASSTNIQLTLRAGYWRNTAAITQIVLTTAAGNFITGTTATLYGLL